MLFSLIFVSLLSFSVSPVYGYINITSQPAKVVNGHYVKLICDVGTMEKTVKWVYDGVTYFSCDPPFTNCFTNINTTNDEYYDFSINNDSLIAIILVRKRQNDGIWSCYHGNETDNFKIDNGDPAQIVQLGNYRPAVCGVKSETPVDVLIYTLGYEGTRILYDVKQSNLSRHRPNDFMLCSETRLYCNATNGYGWPGHKEKEVSVFCPLKVLYNISTFTVSLDDENPFGENGKIKIYFEGYFLPTGFLYRIGPDDIPEESERIWVSIHEQTLQGPAYFYIILFRDKKGPVKAGKYVLTIKQKHITEVVYINIMNPTTTTAPPTKTSTMTTTDSINYTKDKKWPKTTPSPVKTSMKYANYKPTTNRPEVPPKTAHEDRMKKKTAHEDRMKKNYNTDVTSKEKFDRKTPDEITTILYLGVAGFVMSLLLVLMLVVFGLFWFNGVKMKSAGSVDPNQDPIIYTKT